MIYETVRREKFCRDSTLACCMTYVTFEQGEIERTGIEISQRMMIVRYHAVFVYTNCQ